jgi:Protein of unknown function (DUF2917)
MSDRTIATTFHLPATAANPFQVAAEILRCTPMQGEGPRAQVVQVALGVTHAWSLDVRRRPIRIELLEGQVMVTFEGDPADHILAPGSAFTTSGRGRVAVAAFRPSRFSVTAA